MEIYIREKCADCRGRGQVRMNTATLNSVGPCPSCNGKGAIEQWVSVKELLELVAAQQEIGR